MPTLLAIIGRPFIPDWHDLRPFAAELWLIAAMVGVLLAPFFTRRANLACPAVALVGLVMGLLFTVIVGVGPDVAGEHFRGLLVFDGVALAWKVLLLLFTGGVVLMWYATASELTHEGDAAEFFLLLIGATLGMSLMGGTGNLLMLFMAVELASLPSYVLAGFRKTHKLGAEASLKYVLFGAACSGVMAYALSLLYGLYGTLQITEIATAMAHAPAGVSPLAAVALLGLLVGIGFKIAAVPFHFWVPDVFQGAAMEVSLFLSAASKAAGLVLLMRVAQSFAAAYGYDALSSPLTAMTVVLSVVGILTMTAGNVAALVQTNVKRLLGYSSIAHAGYMVCAVALLSKSRHAGANFDPAAVSTQAVLAYLAVYFFMNLGAFTVAGAIFRQAGTEDIRDYAGLGRRSPVLAVCMAAFMVSLIGLPPLAGFWAKVNVMTVLISNGGWWWTPAVAIGVNTVISMYFYLRVVKVMYLEEPRGVALIIRPQPLAAGIAIACAAMLVLMFLGWGLVMAAAGRWGWLATPV
jgi:NADH-quinone oxidoreductase subunit N